MAKLKLSNKELINLGIIDKKKYSTPFDRLQKAIKIMKENGKNDQLIFNKEKKIIILKIENMKILSNNDLLRNDNRKIMTYKKLWHKRIKELTSKYDLSEWESFKKLPLILECLYETRSGKFMDPDAITASFKSPLDGLVESGIIFDDKIKNIPLIIPVQQKNKENRDDLTMVLSPAEDIQKYYTNFFKFCLENNKIK